MLEHLDDERQHKFPCAFDTAVQINGSNQRLKGIGNDGRAGASAGHLLAVSQAQVVAQTDFICHDVQRTLADQRGTQLGQVAFRHGVVVKQIIGNDDGKHRIPQKFLPLVVAHLMTHLVGVGGVGQSYF